METKLSNLRAELSRISHRASYWRAKTLDLREGNTEKSRALHQEIQSLKEKVSSLDLENAEMSETIENILSSEEIVTFEGGKYTDNVRTCVYELLSLNVGVRNIAPAIRCVLKEHSTDVCGPSSKLWTHLSNDSRITCRSSGTTWRETL